MVPCACTPVGHLHHRSGFLGLFQCQKCALPWGLAHKRGAALRVSHDMFEWWTSLPVDSAPLAPGGRYAENRVNCGSSRQGDIDVTTDILRANIERSIETHNRLMDACLPAMVVAADALIAAYRTGHKALFLGNGGSAADAQHLAAEFVGRYLCERRPLPALALHANSSALTAIANDYGYDAVFARQLQALAVAGDVAVAISTSGNSTSVIEGAKAAKRLGLFTIALTGASGGHLRGVVDALIAVPSDETPRVQECHILIGHALCDSIEQALITPERTV